jgi:DNA topoisomerase-3
MGKALILAEKPSVARDIAAALGGFSQVNSWLESPTAIVASAIGHLVKIHAPEAATGGRDLASLPVIPVKFELQPIAKTKAQFIVLAKLLQRPDVDQVVNACDAGREGELIFRLIYELAGCRKTMRRMWLRSMTPQAIREAYRGIRPGAEFDGLADAARCRSEADWLIGINGSRGITRLRERQTHRYEMMSAGRVQTPLLAILVHLELAIRGFVPQDYWEVHATFQAQSGVYVGKWFNPATPVPSKEEPAEDKGTTAQRFYEKARADAIVAQCAGKAPSSVRDDFRASSSAPPRLFDLTSLQREANRRFHFSAKKTLDVAQALYEKHKATTYPRTDSNALPEDYLEKVRDVLGAFHDSTYATHANRVLDNDWLKPDKRIFDNTKISDHFAIIPTGTLPSGLSDAEVKIYDLIVRRFIAAFHPPAEYRITTRLTVVANESFKSTGKVLVTPGWLQVLASSEADEPVPTLCPVTPGEAVRTDAVESLAKQTRPPPRLTDAALLSAMEGAGETIEDDELREVMKERGLGTPATRASHIEGLLSSSDSKGRVKEPYATREGRLQHFTPTDKGMGLIQFLEGNGIEALTSPRMTGEWEKKLREMERGRYRRADFMAEIVALTTHVIEVIRQKAATLVEPEEHLLGAPCPRCGGAILALPRTFECKANCGFRLWREICKRELSEAEGAHLLREGTIQWIEDFISPKTRRRFGAGLRLDPSGGRAHFVFDAPPGGAAAAVMPGGGLAPEIQARCPKCGGTVRVQGRTYACDTGDFKLWSEMAGRQLSIPEVELLIRKREHPPLNGFKSRRGRRFAAGLRLAADLQTVEFIFQ